MIIDTLLAPVCIVLMNRVNYSLWTSVVLLIITPQSVLSRQHVVDILLSMIIGEEYNQVSLKKGVYCLPLKQKLGQ